MRQVGLGLLNYTTAHGGRLPDVSGHGINREEAWIYLLAPYLEDVDAIRICPDDPARNHRLLHKETSFVMNGYVGVVVNVDLPDGRKIKNIYGAVTKLRQVPATSRTIAMFEGTDHVHHDHVHSYEWFSENNIADGHVFDAVAHEVAVDRHQGDVANYLYLDGHVASLNVQQIQEWCDKPFNFAKPER